jgi:hypothetical protein
MKVPLSVSVRRAKAVGWGVVCAVSALTALAGCLPKKESPDNGLFLQRCDPAEDKNCTLTSTAGCFDPDREFCAAYERKQDPWAAEGVPASDYDQREFERAGLNYPDGKVCQTFYASSCGGCPSWTLDSCAEVSVSAILGEDEALLGGEERAPLSRQEVLTRDSLLADVAGDGDEDLCVESFRQQCTDIFSSQCPAATDEICAEAFSVGLEGLVNGEEMDALPDFTGQARVATACREWVVYQCVDRCRDATSKERFTLESCEAAVEERDDSTCGWYRRTQCNLRRGELCGATYTASLAVCEDPAATGSYCEAIVEGQCASALPGLCQGEYPTSLERCLEPSSVPAVCQGAVSERCRLELPSFCQAEYPLTLDLCEDLAGSVPAGCVGSLERGCEALVEEACPTRNAAACAYPELTHPVCQGVLAERCVDWEQDLCDGAFTVDNCADSGRFYDLLDALPPACAGAAADRCESTLVAYAEAERRAEGACLGTIVYVPEAGSPSQAITTEEGFSVPGRFDCVEPVLGEATGLAAQWEADGERISSCEEYAYQYFYTYNRFKNAVEPFKDNARLIYEVAYSEDPAHADFAVGTRALEERGAAFTQLGSATTIGDSPGFNVLQVDRWVSSEPQYGLAPERDYANEFSGAIPRNEFLYVYQSNYDLLEGLTKTWHVGAGLPREVRDDYVDMWAYLDENLSENGNFADYWRFNHRLDNPINGWLFHKAMGDALQSSEGYLGRAVRDPELQHFYARRQRAKEALDDLMAERRACVLETQALNPSQDINLIYQRCELRQGARIGAVAEELARGAYEAWSNGCFDQHRVEGAVFPRPTACDWSPEDFVEDLRRTFELPQQRLVSQCQQMLGHTFEDLRDGYDYLAVSGQRVVRLETSADTARTRIGFEEYLRRRQESQLLMPRYIAQVLSAGPDAQPTWGQAWSDSGEVGYRNLMAAGYLMGAGWQVVPPPNNDPARFAETNVKAEAYLETYAFLFNDRFSILDGQARANAQDNHFGASLKLFGYNVWSASGQVTGQAPEFEPIPDLSYQWSVAFAANPEYSAQDSRRIPLVSVAGLSIFLEIGGAGRVGVEIAARAWFTSAPQQQPATLHMGAQGLVRPYAALSGFVEAGFDLVLVEVGVGGSLELVMIELPFQVDASVRGDGSLSAANVDVAAHTQATLNVNALRGDVYYFIDFGFLGGKHKTTFFREPGVLVRQELFKVDFDERFDVLQAVCDSGLGFCSAAGLGPRPTVTGVAQQEGE